MDLSSDLLRGFTDTIILRRLAAGESYGYRINREISDISGGTFEMKEATLYMAFRRLEAAGYITSRWGDELSGARRRYYALTASGRAKLREDTETWHRTGALIDILLSSSAEGEEEQ